MKLVIAEKPSVAMSLAAVLGANEKKDGYLEGGGYLVSWCVGHLLELAQPEVYGERYARWRYGDLPILPETWKYEVPKDKKKQFDLLCRLMKDKRVESVVCATDAGREGELIFRLVYEHAGCKKPMERLWISSMEDAAIRDGFEHLRPGSDYDKLYDAALCRAGADWLIGINATRLFSVLYGVTLNVGRVMSPTLALLVQREADIQAFTSKPFYVPEITCGGFTASGEKLSGRNEAEKIRMGCDGQGALVLSVEKQVKAVQPPRLYDLTTLQRECNRIYGYTAQQTLDYVQSLYEKKLATYPRTDSQYLTEDMQATAASLVLWLRDHMPFGKGCAGEPDIDRVTDGSKVTDHHAIIPTVEIARTDLSELPSGERDVLTLIAARLLSATAQAHRFETVTAVLDCQGNSFTAKGKTVLQAGWKEVERLYRMGLKESKPEDDENMDASLPMLQEGQQPFPENRYKRQGALAGFGFCAIGFYKNFFSIQPNRCDRVADFNRVLLKVHSSPFQPYNLAATQTIKGGQHNCHLNFTAAHSVEQRVHFVLAVKVPGKFIFLRAVYLVGRVHIDQVCFHCVFQGAVDNRMIVNDRIGLHTLQLFLIKCLDMNRFQVAQRNAEISKVRNDPAVRQFFVACVGCQLDG